MTVKATVSYKDYRQKVCSYFYAQPVHFYPEPTGNKGPRRPREELHVDDIIENVSLGVGRALKAEDTLDSTGHLGGLWEGPSCPASGRHKENSKF